MKIQNPSEKEYTVFNRNISVLLFLTFLILSSVFISHSPKHAVSEYRSSLLQQKTVVDGNVKKTFFLDERGNITIALDYGYSTKTVKEVQGGKIEAYYDPEGNPAKSVLGYYSAYREYDDNGYNTYNTFLDDKGEPMMLPSGYSIEKNMFNDFGQKEMVLFLDMDGNPVCSSAEGYGKRYEYNQDGEICKITYLDQTGNPMIVKKGYASISRSYYSSTSAENGKVEYEFYFDTKGEPISLSLGEYGIHREYNEIGDNTVLTYLDFEGNPMITSRGYTTILREYKGSSYSERYYDIGGQPFKLSEGQYGTNTTNGQVAYLDASGNEQFNIKTFINKHPIFVIVFALCVIILSFITYKRLNIIIIIIYLAAILYFTLLHREKGLSTNAYISLNAYKQFFVNDEARSSIIKNIWLFIPLGAILYRLFPTRTAVLIIPIAVSIIVEFTQFITGLGWCDIDDIISNSIGGFIGYEIGKVVNLIKMCFQEGRNSAYK